MSRRLAAALAAALSLAGCGGGGARFTGDPATAQPVDLAASDAGRAEITALYRQALLAGEDTVVVYSCTGDTEWEPLWQLFAKTFPGVSVTYSHISPSQVMQRIDSETVTHRHFGDVYLTPVNLSESVAKKGYFVSYTPRTIDALEPRYRDPKGLVFYPLAKVFGVAYNPRTVTATEVPRTFAQLKQPRWKSRYTFIKPATQNGTPDVAIAQLQHDGVATRADLEGLRDYGAYASIEAGVTYVSEGRQDLQLWAYLPTVQRQLELGAPVGIVFPPNFSALVPFGASISRNAVHPAAARLFEAWILTPPAQAALARDVGMFATTRGAPRPQLFPDPAGEAALHDSLAPKPLAVALKQGRDDLKAIFNETAKP